MSSREIFCYSDCTDDNIRVIGFHNGEIVIKTRNNFGTTTSVHLDPNSVDLLRTVLGWYGANAKGHASYALKPGDKVRILNEVDFLFGATTRGEIAAGLDDENEYAVRLADGSYAGSVVYIPATHVVPLDEDLPTKEIKVGYTYRLLPNSTYKSGIPSMFSATKTTRVRVLRDVLPDGDVLVVALDGVQPPHGRFQAHVSVDYLVPLDEE